MKDNIKICLVNTEFIPFRSSGQAVYAEKIAKGLAAHHDITVVTSTTEKTRRTEHINNIRVIRIPAPQYDPSKWIGFGYRTGNFIEQLNEKEHFDIVHFLDCHVGYACRSSFVATLHQSFNQRLKGYRGLPYHSSLFNLLKRYPYYQLARFLEKKALKKAKAFISISKATKDEFAINYQINSSKIEVVYNGIDTEFFRPVDPYYLKRKLGLDKEKILLYVGFTTPRKGVESLAQALNMLESKNIKLIMVGKWEKRYREKFFRHLGKCKDKVIEAGYIKDSEMPAYYSLADIFVLPSLLEGFGFPLAEAMACSTSVISTNVGSIPEVIGNCGIIIPPQDSILLAKNIDWLLSDKDLMETFKDKARKRVCENFSETVMVERTIGFYRKILNSNPVG